jgi:hypothetical protein
MQPSRRSVAVAIAVLIVGAANVRPDSSVTIHADPVAALATNAIPVGSGALDPTFATKGTLKLAGGESIAGGTDGHLWVLGSVVHPEGVTRYLNRFTAEGGVDPTFTGATQTSSATDLTVGPILLNPAGGASFAINRCCRANRPPTSQVAVHTVARAGTRPVGPAGIAQWPLASAVPKAPADADYVLGGVVRLSDGRMRACVSVYPGGERNPFAALVGFRADGTVDPAVGAADRTMPTVGWTKLAGLDDCGFASAGQQQLLVDRADRLYVLGSATGVTPAATRVVRISAAGVADPGYGVAGAATIRSATRQYNPLTAAITDRGVLYLGLSSKNTKAGSTAVATVVKLTAIGRRDTGFGRNGVRRFFPSGGSSELDSIVIAPTDRLIVGVVYTAAGARSGRLMAVSAVDAARATGFGTRGSVLTGNLTWGMLVRGRYLLTIGSRVPVDPEAYLGATLLQRRRL